MSEDSDQEMNSQSHDDNEPSILDWLKFSFLKLFRKRSTDPENIRINSLRKEPESCREGDLNEISIPDQKNVEGNSSGGGDNAGEQFFSINFPVPQRTHIELIVDTTEIKEDGKVISYSFPALIQVISRFVDQRIGQNIKLLNHHYRHQRNLMHQQVLGIIGKFTLSNYLTMDGFISV